jgi:plastocyanin
MGETMTQRIFTALATTVVAAAIACGGGSSSTASTPTPTPTPKTVSLTESEFKIDPGTLSLKPGTYIFQLQNGGNFSHDLHIATSDGSEIAHSDLMAKAASTTFQVDLKKGTYTMWCAVDGHRQRGMQGTITVA